MILRRLFLRTLIAIALALIGCAAFGADTEAPYVVFLGTSAADLWPDKVCNCEKCTYVKEHGGKNMRRFASLYVHPGMVIDFTVTGMAGLKEWGISPGDVNCLLTTHSHDDHCHAESIVKLADARARTVKSPLKVYGDSTAVSKLRKYADGLGRAVPFELVQLKPFQEFEACGWNGKTFAANHAPDDEECLLYVLRKGDRALLYALDTAWFPARTFHELHKEKLDLAIVDSTAGPGDWPESQITHMNFELNRKIKRLMDVTQVLKPGGTYALTHLSVHAVPPYDQIHEKMAAEGFLIPYDGLKLEVGRKQ